MDGKKITPRELWSKQQITDTDVDYIFWNEKRKTIQEIARVSHSCLFTVDVFKERYDFASDNFVSLFGYNPAWIETIRRHGDLLEERIHPDDRLQLMEFQIEHGEFIYSLPAESRNDYSQIFRFRMKNVQHVYMNVISRHQVIETDRNGKAWIVMGMIDVAPDQSYKENVGRTVINKKTGEIIVSDLSVGPKSDLMKGELTKRERDVLSLIRQGFLSKEIADKLNLSIYTINNHRKNILHKLHVDNAIEAINVATQSEILE
ncbi:MAG: LuxR C-terminal-related transcriptional regulator [Candidatus Azobacteroides sp.]|nr:LuxR C-terminal-related transcriptional regulator [Candidatus Azobacteroides sp.]